MIEELNSASKQLCLALERYLLICSEVQSLCLERANPHTTSPDYAQQIERELELAELYDTTMQQARSAIKIARSYALGIGPIYSLPPEILTRIFYIVRDADPCQVDPLAFVCSRWRSIALGSPSLWSHIDYHPHSGSFRPELVARARLHVTRSGETPLEFHISAQSDAHSKHCHSNSVDQLCELVAPRMRSLILNFQGFIRQWRRDEGKSSILDALFSNCPPGMLTKFVAVDTGRDHAGYIQTVEDIPSYSATIRLSLKPAELDTIFSSVTVLHLNKTFPYWTSRAYHGLVDLRLGCTPHIGDCAMIPESDLVEILRASPGLRILHFGFRVSKPEGPATTFPRVRLANLEVLHIQPYNKSPFFPQIEAVLRMLEPGPDPLHLSIRHHKFKASPGSATTETKAFLSRSNVTKLYVNQLAQLPELLPSLLQLEVLVLSDQTSWPQPKPLTHPDPDHANSQTARNQYPQLDACFLLGCSLAFDELLAVARYCKPKTLTLFKNKVQQQNIEELMDTEKVREGLSAVCSDVRIANAFPSLAEHRDLLYGH